MNSFSFDLIHHDSKLSPFYDQSKTESELSKEALIRSLNRLNRFNSSMLRDAKYVESDLTIGDYLMSIYIVFGCDEAHQGDFKDGVQGVVGLGPGPLSLVSQVGNKFGESANKLSYCLVEKPLELHSKIKFGSDLTLYKQNTEYTVQFKPSPPHTSYHLNLEAISVNDEKIEIPNKKHDMIVDIQTSLTSLPSNIYNEFIAKVKKHFGDAHSIEEPEHGTCFLKRQVDGLERPKVVFHFSGLSESHGDFPVNPSTIFQENVEYMCLTIVRKDGVSILGNRAQVDVQMLFDLSTHSLTFAALNCIKVSF
ncbi:aspartic proteinase CDR1-like [Tripterygium wilfordii]|uniref:aspartic proteinase CDR1-like n=1 Tax=Tripterygium wilfordii TaxID=458696 RepID=UPI0018F85600|nr:aspartic proteinase CDR1-like [Tripterygium wilfordii]